MICTLLCILWHRHVLSVHMYLFYKVLLGHLQAAYRRILGLTCALQVKAHEKSQISLKSLVLLCFSSFDILLLLNICILEG